jgi:hypothetical protein
MVTSRLNVVTDVAGGLIAIASLSVFISLQLWRLRARR